MHSPLSTPALTKTHQPNGMYSPSAKGFRRASSDSYEKDGDPKILDKQNFTGSKRFLGFAIEDKTEYRRLRKRFHHNIVYTDREKSRRRGRSMGPRTDLKIQPLAQLSGP